MIPEVILAAALAAASEKPTQEPVEKVATQTETAKPTLVLSLDAVAGVATRDNAGKPYGRILATVATPRYFGIIRRDQIGTEFLVDRVALRRKAAGPLQLGVDYFGARKETPAGIVDARDWYLDATVAETAGPLNVSASFLYSLNDAIYSRVLAELRVKFGTDGCAGSARFSANVDERGDVKRTEFEYQTPPIKPLGGARAAFQADDLQTANPTYRLGVAWTWNNRSHHMQRK